MDAIEAREDKSLVLDRYGGNSDHDKVIDSGLEPEGPQSF
jgi:hypothetical protein